MTDHDRPIDQRIAPKLCFVVAGDRHGQRIDRFLTGQLRNFTSWRFARLVNVGLVWIDSRPARAEDRVYRGQTVMVQLADGADKLLAPEAGDLEFLYCDPWMAVVNKQADVVVHPTGPIDSGTLCNHLQAWLDEKTILPSLLRPGIVHRLDRETSGALAVAFEAESHRVLSEAFEESRVSKSYLALVEGIVAEDQVSINRAIGRARTNSRVLMTCRGDAVDRRPATTHVRVVRRFERSSTTLVRCVPRTGRNHQIRVHLASEGHPLVGDEYYRADGAFHTVDSDRNAVRVATLPLTRHALHAERLALAHPIGGAWVDVLAPLPGDFATSLAILANREF